MEMKYEKIITNMKFKNDGVDKITSKTICNYILEPY